MRIVQVVPDFGLGGIQKGGCVLAAALAEMGHESHVLAPAGGPRFLAQCPPGLTHHIAPDGSATGIAQVIKTLSVDVVHIHDPAYRVDLIELVRRSPHSPLVVSTPVFGRLPAKLALLRETRTCLVGIYTFYRFCRWSGMSFDRAVASGIGYVPITPFEPPSQRLSTTDDTAAVLARRAGFGIPPAVMVVGRIGRQHPSKWDDSSPQTVDALLQQFPDAHWLSIGFPDELHRARLAERWGDRFHDLRETSDYALLTRMLSCLDVQVFFGRGECFASTIAEAAGTGVPTIALATPLRDNGQAEQVIDGFNGYLVGSVTQAVQRVGELKTNPTLLADMKRHAEQHCLERWQSRRAAEDLLSLYQHWSAPAPQQTPYVTTMLQESNLFAATYHDRIASLLGTSPVSRARWRCLLWAAENRQIWLIGRALNRLRRSIKR